MNDSSETSQKVTGQPDTLGSQRSSERPRTNHQVDRNRNNGEMEKRKPMELPEGGLEEEHQVWHPSIHPGWRICLVKHDCPGSGHLAQLNRPQETTRRLLSRRPRAEKGQPHGTPGSHWRRPPEEERMEASQSEEQESRGF